MEWPIAPMDSLCRSFVFFLVFLASCTHTMHYLVHSCPSSHAFVYRKPKDGSDFMGSACLWELAPTSSMANMSSKAKFVLSPLARLLEKYERPRLHLRCKPQLEPQRTRRPTLFPLYNRKNLQLGGIALSKLYITFQGAHELRLPFLHIFTPWSFARNIPQDAYHHVLRTRSAKQGQRIDDSPSVRPFCGSLHRQWSSCSVFR